MLFKKRMPVTDYCVAGLKTVFEEGREATWETLRDSSTDRALKSADAKLYHAHLSAVYVELMLIAIAKNCKLDLTIEGNVFVSTWLKEQGRAEIQNIAHEYSQAFASSMTDGVMAMVHYFADNVVGSELQRETIEQLYREFYAILDVFFKDFKAIKLVSARPR